MYPCHSLSPSTPLPLCFHPLPSKEGSVVSAVFHVSLRTVERLKGAAGQKDATVSPEFLSASDGEDCYISDFSKNQLPEHKLGSHLQTAIEFMHDFGHTPV